MAGSEGTSRPARGEGGAAAVEFALVAPLVLLLLFGIVSYGFLLSFRQALSQGAAEGARSAAVWAAAYASSQDAARKTAATASVDEALQSYGVACGPTGATCTVAIAACSGDPAAQCASVTVSYPYGARPLIPRLPLIPLPATVEYEAQARVS
ncbi:pilus assembly protein TadE [Nocardioides gansuensis]|uniref:Pilus assembly protein TadE n=1 Tax=Nocardioides gansuensis TaxID=2138300 RepID=A0A2T8FBD9_9ACTN|nr:TadE/TadG family type IV pilus assembly protein [Nocardioides gansuensis]PVG83026.1 pilus assembly protein TadE [Nocardioides gansuensis]